MDELFYTIQRQVAPLFRRHGWDYELTDEYAQETGDRMTPTGLISTRFKV